MPTIVSSGDAGDVVAGMLIARHLEGSHLILTQGPPPHRPFRAMAQMLLPLLRSQPYIHSATWAERPTGATHELIHWRKQFYKPNQTLAQSQADSLGLKYLDHSPWLDIEPNPIANGKVIICRTKRYNNPRFPWRTVLQRFKNNHLFVGLDDERHQLEIMGGGVRIQHHRIKDFLEFARLIAGSECLITNQTCAWWLGAGMGHPVIQEQEMTRKIHDAVIDRPNLIYSKSGEFPITLPPKMKFDRVIDFQI